MKSTGNPTRARWPNYSTAIEKLLL
jgi:hypothetical protein